MEQKGLYARYALSVSIALLASALVYFTYTIQQVVQRLPVLLDQTGATLGLIDPVLAQTQSITSLVPQVLEESAQIRAQVSPILAEVEAVRSQVPPLLAEVAEVRKQLPAVLAEIAAVRNSLSPVLSEVRKVRSETIPDVLREVRNVREAVPPILAESANLRATIPPTLDRIDGIVNETKTIANSAGENAVSGFFTGIVKAPFKLLTSVGETVLPSSAGINKNFRADILSAYEKIVNTGEPGETLKVVDKKSGGTAELSVLSEAMIDDKVCKDVSVHVTHGAKTIEQRKVTACHNEDGTWTVRHGQL